MDGDTTTKMLVQLIEHVERGHKESLFYKCHD
jgi:hypothetical protein